MRILTTENEHYELDYVPEEIDDIRYCVLDYTDRNDVDYLYVPLVFLELFEAPAAVLKIGDTILKMPLDWSIIVSDPECTEPEIVPITSLNDRGFMAFSYNPWADFIPKFSEVEIVNIFQDVSFTAPKLKNGHILAVPLTDEPKSQCVYFVKETTKVPDILDSSQLW